VIKSLNAQMLSLLLFPPFQLGPAPLTCPVCGTTRDACLRFYGRDRQHEEAIRAVLDHMGCGY
jgi:hypothetical protein